MAAYDNIRIPWPEWNITAELGAGRYGKVYRIERTQSGITEAAALKVISIPKNKTDYDAVRFTLDTDDETEEYFTKEKENILKEIKTMYQLKGCANIVNIEDWAVVEKDNAPGWDIYIRMELLTPLREWLRSREMTEKDVIRFGIDICNALVRCEKEDFIHGDIKPENIMVDRDGDFKLADFGIDRVLDIVLPAVARIGARYYSTPEFYTGDLVSSTADLYSLGLVMYELLNDFRLPFVPENKSIIGAHKAVQRRISGETIPEPKKGSPGLKKIILKACAFEPEDRYRTAGEMKRDLEGYPFNYINRTCLSCGYINPPENDFCSRCGSVFEDDTDITMLYASPFAMRIRRR